MASDSGADAELRERVAQLEETVAEQQATSESPEQPSASRRGFVKAAAAVAGLGALGIYSSYPASAQAAGQIGTSSEPVDVEAYDLNVQGTATGLLQNPLTADLDAGGNSLTNVTDVVADSVSTKTIADDYLYAGAFAGSDPDARLDNALNAAVDGETIYLEQGVYNANHTVSNRVTLTGLGTDISGTKIESTIDLTANNIILGTVRLTGTLNVSGYTCILKDAFALNGSVSVSGGRFRMYGCHGGNVTFQSGTSGGVVEASTGVSVTDNGNNVDYADFDATDNNRVQTGANDSLIDPVFANGDKGLLSIKQAEMRQDGVSSGPGAGQHLYALAIDTPPNSDTTNAINMVYEGGESAIGIAMQNSNSRSALQLAKAGSFSGPLIELKDTAGNGGTDIFKPGGEPIVFEQPFTFDGSNMDMNVNGQAAKISVDSENDASFTDAKMIFYKHGNIGSGNETEWLKFRDQESEPHVEVHVDGNEVMRIKDNGDLDVSGSVNANAF